MNVAKKVTLSLVAVSAVGLAFALGNAVAADPDTATPSNRSAPSLSQDEAHGLAFTRDEERMARDLYQLFADKYDVAPFTMIVKSEQHHMDAVATLLTRYDVDDPAKDKKAGEYADATIQKLYDDWKASGLKSVKAAYQVGVDLEKRDIADLEKLQEATSNTDLDRLYANLEQASRHHLSAYTAAVEGKPMGHGNGRGQGMGGGPGGPGGPGMGGPGMGPRSGQRSGSGPGYGPGSRQADCPRN